MYLYIVKIKLYKVVKYKNTIYCLHNIRQFMDPVHGFHMSSFIFHELSMQLIIELLLTFIRSIKQTIRFLSKISKLSMFCVHSDGTTPWG